MYLVPVWEGRHSHQDLVSWWRDTRWGVCSGEALVPWLDPFPQSSPKGAHCTLAVCFSCSSSCSGTANDGSSDGAWRPILTKALDEADCLPPPAPSGVVFCHKLHLHWCLRLSTFITRVSLPTLCTCYCTTYLCVQSIKNTIQTKTIYIKGLLFCNWRKKIWGLIAMTLVLAWTIFSAFEYYY